MLDDLIHMWYIRNKTNDKSLPFDYKTDYQVVGGNVHAKEQTRNDVIRAELEYRARVFALHI